MKHDSFLCPTHAWGCVCPPSERDQLLCNPYWVSGYCPTDGEGEHCTADPSRLERKPVLDAADNPIGFTLIVR